MDEKDVLKKYKEEFYLPDYLYYEANGLGPMSRRSEATLNRVAEEWKNLLVAGWFAGEFPGSIIRNELRPWKKNW